ncbi:hypothetical protein C499_05940 [Halogeometricum borinquense DSM 11551]|uniref:Uncharacterized protein n=1 Tax=Halogeometricum borinquense (strain ATCC 700274 / DSM 11551 / JCM 10706 / KCTC 4070 / PR3) TaxID=469382 RepID=E4NVD4_HALBP|nr:hypothetical protein [Halogeometricum borinquense]ADQ68818.1 hypothetical protein Hbor_32880 [Halogeometricum borinquense DSM 11551]ELY29375.1 hypothetical protein C499_05940 [Halogeometricum borinquense DSM 11551]
MAQSNLSYSDLASSLYSDCHTEQDVTEFLHDQLNDAEWVALGNQSNNYSIVENQQSEPMAALTELIVNSIDAIILKQFHQTYGDDFRGDEFKNLHEAVEGVVDLDTAEINLTATGEQNGPLSLSLYDNGCGQPRDRFEKTFLNVLTPGEIKQDYDFLQGKYGMGSTGVLPFCGERGYKFIASAAYDEEQKWSWSLIRKNREKTRYEYLKIDGEIPTFEGKFAEESSGTFVKVFDYDAEYKSNITKYFRGMLERYLVNSPIPITLRETRYSSSWGDQHTRGLRPRLNESPEVVKDVDKFEHTFDNDVLGTKQIEIYLIESKKELEERGINPDRRGEFVGGKQNDHAILFTVNGQTHGDQGATFLKTRCSYNRVGGDSIVMIDFSDVSDSDIVDLFKPSRDRLQNKDPAKALKSELEEILIDNDMLDREEQRRRDRITKEDADDLSEDILEDLLERNPSIKRYLETGEKKPRVKDGDGKQELEEYDGEFFPDRFFAIKKFRSRSDYEIYSEDDEDGERFRFRVPVNSDKRVRFELNAEDDYLTRNMERGEIKSSIPPVLKTKHLKHGILNLTFEPPSGAEVGDQVPIRLQVSPAKPQALSLNVVMECTEPVEEEPKLKKKPDKTPAEGFELPHNQWVDEEEWDDFEFDEQSIVSVQPRPGESGMDIFINRDAAPLQNYLKRHNLKDSGKTMVMERYRLATVFFSATQYIELRQQYQEHEDWEEIELTRVVEDGMRGIGQVLLDLIIDDETLDKVTY